ncbi:MAG: hypothetical protein H8D56_16005, partial [Planctomycetes bacterium]|nr:hypothetical protein [Planctomycetota bacterium]
SLFTHFSSTLVESALQIHPFMQNKPNFRNAKININLDMTSNYKEFANRSHEKTKPIQSQFKPKQTQFKPKTKPKQTQSLFLPILPDLYILYPLTGIKNKRDGKP